MILSFICGGLDLV